VSGTEVIPLTVTLPDVLDWRTGQLFGHCYAVRQQQLAVPIIMAFLRQLREVSPVLDIHKTAQTRVAVDFPAVGRRPVSFPDHAAVCDQIGASLRRQFVNTDPFHCSTNPLPAVNFTQSVMFLLKPFQKIAAEIVTPSAFVPPL